MDVSKAEPVFHKNIETIIALNKEGITLGVKPEENVGPEGNWDVEINKTIAVNKKMKSKIMLQDDGTININSFDQQKWINIGVGQDAEDARIELNAGGVGLISGGSSITINKDEDIEIDTTDKNITLNPGNGMVDIKGNKVKILGSEFTKKQVNIGGNLTILAS